MPAPPPANDAAIDEHLEHLTLVARMVEMDLVKLRYYLKTYPNAEFTVEQAKRLGDMLLPIAQIANEIMFVDIDRTERREGVTPEYDA
jgi:hypothetical protein